MSITPIRTKIARDEMALIFELRAAKVSVRSIALIVGYSATAISRGITVAEEFGMEACR